MIFKIYKRIFIFTVIALMVILFLQISFSNLTQEEITADAFSIPIEISVSSEKTDITNMVTMGIPLDELQTAVNVREGELIGAKEFKASLLSNETYIELQDNDNNFYWIKSRIKGASLIQGTTKREQIFWQDVLPGVDIKQRLYQDRIKEDIILKDDKAPEVFEFELFLSRGLSPAQEEEKIVFYNNKGKNIIEISPPSAIDAAGKEYKFEYVLKKNTSVTSGQAVLELKPKEALINVVYPLVIDPSYTVYTGYVSVLRGTGYHSQRKLARKLNGDLWCVYHRYDGISSYQIYASYSTDEGETWTEEVVTSASNDQEYPSIAIDSSDNIHVVWRGRGWGANPTYGNIQYRKKTDSWQAQEAITDINGSQYYVAIAIDSSDNIHVVWSGNGWGINTGGVNVQYRKKTDSWQVQEGLTDVDDWEYDPSIAIDSLNNVHVVWRGGSWGTYPSSDDIQYRKRTTSWQAQEAITNEIEYQYSPSIALDSSDNVHVVWYGNGWGTNPGACNVQYRKRTTSWQEQEAITDIENSQFSPSVAIDGSDNIHVAWGGWGWGINTSACNVQYREKTDSWQAQEAITDIDANQDYSNIMWANYPEFGGFKTNRPKNGYALIWTDDSKAVQFHKSNNLDWDLSDTLYVGYPSAQAETSNPTNLAYATPFFSGINNNNAAISLIHIQLTTEGDPGYANPVWDSGDIDVSELSDGSISSVAIGSRTPDIFYGMGIAPSGILEAGQNYIWRFRTKAVVYSDWENSVIKMASDNLTARFYAGSGIGFVSKYNVDWDTAHDADIGSGSGGSSAFQGYALSQWSDILGEYYIYRGFLPFDTSGIDDSLFVNSANLNLYIENLKNEDNDGDNFISVVQTSQVSPTSITTSDYNQCGAINDPVEGAIRVSLNDMTVMQYSSWTLNSIGKSWINKTGWTQLGTREGHDILDHPVDNSFGKENMIFYRQNRYNGIAFDPYIEVTYGETAIGVSDQEHYRWREDVDTREGFSSSTTVNAGGEVKTTYLLEESDGDLYWTFGGYGYTAYLFRSTDGGATFTTSTLVYPAGDVYSSYLLEESDGNLYWAFTSYTYNTAYLYRSTDSGANFTELTKVDLGYGGGVWATHLLEGSDGDLYWTFGSSDGNAYLYRSTDSGNTFTISTTVTTGGSVENTYLLEGYDGDLYWAFGSWDNTAYLYRSTDSGNTFTISTTVTTGGSLYDTHLLEGSDGDLYWTFGSSDGNAYLYRSTDSGNTFTISTTVTTGGSIWTTHLLEESADGDLYWAFTSFDDTAYLYRSTDSGNIFTISTTVTTGGNNVYTTHLLEGSDGILYWAFGSADDTAHLHRSTDGGASFTTFTTINTGGNVYTTHLLEESADGDLHWAFGSEDIKAYLYRSQLVSEVVPNWLVNEDTVYMSATTESVIRLRIKIVNISETAINNRQYQLEYATKNGTICGDDEIFAAVPITAATEPFEMVNSCQYIDGATTTVSFLSHTATTTWTNGYNVEDPSNKTLQHSLNSNYYTEFEYALKATSNANGSYCFRLTDNGSSLNFIYNIYPEFGLSVIPDFSISSGDITFSNNNPFPGGEVTVSAIINNNGSDYNSTALTDQEFTGSADGSLAVFTGEYLAENFNPNTTFILDKVQLYMRASGICGTLTVEIREEGGTGLPDGATLASATRSTCSPINFDWVDIKFDEYPTLNNGQDYWIVAKGDGVDFGNCWGWVTDYTTPVWSGEFAADIDGGAENWTVYAGYDAFFKIFKSEGDLIDVNFFDGDPDISGTSIGSTSTIASLASGETTTVAIAWTAGSEGDHDIYIHIDRADKITENNVINNKAYTAITVISPPSEAPNIPILNSPLDGTVGITTAPDLIFNYSDPNSSVCTQFDIQLDNNPGFGSPEINETDYSIGSPWVSGSTITYSAAPDILTDFTQYYWKARVYNGGVWSDWSDGMWDFTTGASIFSGDFEFDFGSWHNIAGDDFDWTRNSGSTPSSGTGPSSAHSDSYYVYTESSSPNYPSKTAILEGPTFTFTSASINFWYHMYGISIGTLYLEIASAPYTTWDTVWSLSGDRGNLWYFADVDLNPYAGDLKRLRFRGAIADSYTSDMALDDIIIIYDALLPPNIPGINSPLDGAVGVTTTPDLMFNYSDPNGDNCTQFDIQLDNDPGFGSPEINETDYSIGGPWMSGSAITYSITSAVLSEGTRYYWKVRVYDETGPSDWSDGSWDFTVGTAANPFPTANIVIYPDTINRGETVDYNASASSDPDGTIQKYEWDFYYDEITFDIDRDTGLVSTTTFTYPQGGIYIGAVRVTDNDNNTNIATATITVINRSPVSIISCDPEGCDCDPLGCGTPPDLCTGYTGRAFILHNTSTDPDGSSDIIKSEWWFKNEGETEYTIKASCPPNSADPFCSYTPPTSSDIPPGNHIIKLYVEDSEEASSTITESFTILTDIKAGFLCSLNGIHWVKCENINPYIFETVYFSSNQDDPYNSSNPSDEASISTSTWRKKDIIFSDENNFNSTTTFNFLDDKFTTIELTVVDSNGRTDSKTHNIAIRVARPQWREASPFDW